MVLSLSPPLAGGTPNPGPGTLVQILTTTSPNLAGAGTGIGGGPVLVRSGRRQRMVPPPAESYEFTSWLERHPRTAIGWTRTDYVLVVVDGRQRDVSVGMTLEELARHLVGLGCQEAMNLDGGGSATLWFDGAVRNTPCDGYERPVANSVLVVRRPRD
jgi:exopolysaccharide biosynthesis protein